MQICLEAGCRQCWLCSCIKLNVESYAEPTNQKKLIQNAALDTFVPHKGYSPLQLTLARPSLFCNSCTDGSSPMNWKKKITRIVRKYPLNGRQFPFLWFIIICQCLMKITILWHIGCNSKRCAMRLAAAKGTPESNVKWQMVPLLIRLAASPFLWSKTLIGFTSVHRFDPLRCSINFSRAAVLALGTALLVLCILSNDNFDTHSINQF